jgi:hypothetical protein
MSQRCLHGGLTPCRSPEVVSFSSLVQKIRYVIGQRIRRQRATHKDSTAAVGDRHDMNCAAAVLAWCKHKCHPLKLIRITEDSSPGITIAALTQTVAASFLHSQPFEQNARTESNDPASLRRRLRKFLPRSNHVSTLVQTIRNRSTRVRNYAALVSPEMTTGPVPGIARSVAARGSVGASGVGKTSILKEVVRRSTELRTWGLEVLGDQWFASGLRNDGFRNVAGTA